METEQRAASDRHQARRLGNQVQRAMAAIALCVDGLPDRERLLVLNGALREAPDEAARRERMRRLVSQ
jgi:hypothetical protein